MAIWKYLRNEPYDSDDNQWLVTYLVTYKKGKRVTGRMEYTMLLPKGIRDHRRVPKESPYYYGPNQQDYKFGKSKRVTTKGEESKTEWKEGDMKNRFKNKAKSNVVSTRIPKDYRWRGY